METWNDRLNRKMREKGIKNKDLVQAVGVSAATVSGWTSGDIKEIKADNARKLARKLGVFSDWLLDGRGPEGPDSIEDAGTARYEVLRLPADVPLISSVQAGDWDEANDQHQPGDAETYLFCNKPHSSRTFALRVDGDSMTSPAGRTYPNGSIIYVDPEQRGGVVPGDPVIAKLNGDDRVTFKQLAQDREGLYLKPLNPLSEPIYGEFRILGKVIHAELPW